MCWRVAACRYAAPLAGRRRTDDAASAERVEPSSEYRPQQRETTVHRPAMDRRLAVATDARRKHSQQYYGHRPPIRWMTTIASWVHHRCQHAHEWHTTRLETQRLLLVGPGCHRHGRQTDEVASCLGRRASRRRDSQRQLMMRLLRWMSLERCWAGFVRVSSECSDLSQCLCFLLMKLRIG